MKEGTVQLGVADLRNETRRGEQNGDAIMTGDSESRLLETKMNCD